MNISARLVLSLLVPYFLGSVSFAIIISEIFYKKDIRSFGSGNAGMTNILRTFGKKAAAATVIGDFLKGTVSVLFARMLFSNSEAIDLIVKNNQVQAFNIFNFTVPIDATFILEMGIYLAVTGAFLGHLYPVYFKFKGGKGMSVIAGAMIAATPITLSIALAIFIVISFTVKIVSLASVVSSVSYIFINIAYCQIVGRYSFFNIVVSLIFPLFIIYSHRANMKRLLNGTEYKFGQKKDKD